MKAKENNGQPPPVGPIFLVGSCYCYSLSSLLCVVSLGGFFSRFFASDFRCIFQLVNRYVDGKMETMQEKCVCTVRTKPASDEHDKYKSKCAHIAHQPTRTESKQSRHTVIIKRNNFLRLNNISSAGMKKYLFLASQSVSRGVLRKLHTYRCAYLYFIISKVKEQRKNNTKLSFFIFFFFPFFLLFTSALERCMLYIYKK